MIGKILYNKRIDPQTGVIRAMTKTELTTKPFPKIYFDIQNFVNDLPCEPKYFSNMLIENSFDHFKDIKELAKATETFSHCDVLDKYSYTSKYCYEENKMQTLLTQLNIMACVYENKSQYDNKGNEKGKGFSAFRKPSYDHYQVNLIKRMNRESYYKAIDKNPICQKLGLKKFSFEVQPVLKILKNINEAKKANTRNLNIYKTFQTSRSETVNDEEVLTELKIKNEFAEEVEKEESSLNMMIKTSQIKESQPKKQIIKICDVVEDINLEEMNNEDLANYLTGILDEDDDDEEFFCDDDDD